MRQSQKQHMDYGDNGKIVFDNTQRHDTIYYIYTIFRVATYPTDLLLAHRLGPLANAYKMMANWVMDGYTMEPSPRSTICVCESCWSSMEHLLCAWRMVANQTQRGIDSQHDLRRYIVEETRDTGFPQRRSRCDARVPGDA